MHGTKIKKKILLNFSSRLKEMLQVCLSRRQFVSYERQIMMTLNVQVTHMFWFIQKSDKIG
jgi:hypothetical protein